ncbi:MULTISPECIES: ABC transporter substrate-binding protein [Rhizobium/Agrobacterium group]|jgi:sorbitol/mannitol transport system substrate-binding protein|uniref:Sugar ABC transporter substrate-binding protein n=2 Tax=Rhizobium/Agrobacterium group TaxID=227290 RepID=A0AA92C0V4_RHIRH|nr:MULTISPECIES: sugar ABC transporter substrate-binding protein [Rhizobium/Agrobacterium group]KQM31905.1 sugar ABC transporter substrate-binding protein [Rhizobium sp. Leaf202]KQN83365.1 sugar ABC transporter substrate-binding protein [Rhizobium sp. Leaf68]KQR30820.1 sugar ABC transporter substrate-binding protein [Rhizobium sp. Leaf155]PVE67348.1 sugar ABC transporter substrate-binding protein [Agrobacterium tumefaciens]PVE77125.1 sugar ABC transporter substrate-binding protein [Sphingomona
MTLKTLLLGACSALALSGLASAETLTIATVNNGDMIRMQGLTKEFTDKNPDIQIEWVTLEENVLRERVTTDIATNGGQYDIMTIGNYEVPIWAKQGWLLPLEKLGDKYDVNDMLPSIRGGLTVEGKLYAAPFYGESAMIMYRKDLFEKAGLKMPENPTWEFIGDAARKITDRKADVNGICLRGKAGWGENMAFITALTNSFGGRWFDENWKPQFDQPEWKNSLQFYVDLMKDAGPSGAASNGFNENLTLFQQGKCGMWIDATVAASFVSNPKDSKVADKVGYALFPTHGELKNHGNWLWSWNLAIPKSSQKAESAEKFIAWATSKDYSDLVASKEGWANVPPGTRTSLYKNADYEKAAPFAKTTLAAMNAADITKPTVKPVPYTGGQFVAIPEFQSLGTTVGQLFSAVVAGQSSVDDALAGAQSTATREMTRAGYIK